MLEQCAFCGGKALHFAFSRRGRRFLRCALCRGYLQADRQSGVQQTYENGAFAERIRRQTGEAPATAALDEVARELRPHGRWLEVGCGTGHLLAAARLRGFAVSGIETSPYHRELIRQLWGIETFAQPLESADLEPDTFDNVVSVNVFEHLAEPELHLRQVARVLKGAGRCYISTANADCLVARICGAYWPMFKPPDHLSIPSPESLRRCAQSAGLSILRVWCTEYPLETPLGFALALRDWWSERRTQDYAGPAGGAKAADDWSERPTRGRLDAAAWSLVEARMFGFVGAAFGKMMIAGSVKALLEKPGRNTNNHAPRAGIQASSPPPPRSY